MRKRIILLFLFNIIVFNLLSQQFFFRNFSIDKGLPQSNVYCLLQDSRGYIWMGTDGGGICRYDGINIEIINKTNGLTGNIVRSLFEDSKGNIWIGTDNGITLYDGLTYRKISKSENFEGSFALKIIESKDGKIWAATNDAGLYKIEFADSLIITNYSISDGLVNNFIFDIYEDQNQRVWLAMIGGINILQFTNQELTITKLIQNRDLPAEFITCIEPAKNGELLFGTYENGAFKITNPESSNSFKVIPIDKNIIPNDITIWDIHYQSNGETWFATDDMGIIRLDAKNIIQHFNKDNGINAHQILDILEDYEGNLWFSSMGSGVYIYSGDELLSYVTKDGLPDNYINSVLINNDNYYIGTNEGLGEYKYYSNSLLLNKTYTASSGLTSNKVHALSKDKNNRVWAGTNEGISVIGQNSIQKLTEDDGLNSNKINCIYVDAKDNVWVGTDNGYNKITQGKIYSFTEDEGFINSEIQTIIEDSKGKIWMGTLGGLVCLDNAIYRDYNEEEGLTELRIHSLAEDRNGNIWIGTFGGGLFIFDQTKDSMQISLVADKSKLSSNNIYSLLFANDTTLIVGTDKGFDYIILDKSINPNQYYHFNTNDGFTGGENNLNAIAYDKNGYIWFGTINGLVRLDPSELFTNADIPKIYITKLKLFFKDVDWESRKTIINKWFSLPDYLKLTHNENHLTFSFSGIFLKNPEGLEYSYYLEGQSKEWSPYSSSNEVVFQGLAPGDYTFKVKAKTKLGTISPVDEFSFYIKPPFYKTTWFIALVIITLSTAIIAFVRYRESKLRKDKAKLERIVKERTHEIEEQKNEILIQRDIVTSQKKEITDSIKYAQTIQKAVLSKEEILKTGFSDFFILFRPKDIVSGDFYWVSKKDNYIIFTAADCTGHGVPGAFMSMLGVSFLNKIVNEQGVTQPNLILNKLRENIIDSLQQKGVSQENKDGMDIAICTFNTTNNKLQFSGANNPMLLIKKNNHAPVLEEIKADRMPVAIYTLMNEFSINEFELEKGDSIYLFSDGFIDQFGGPSSKKFMKKNFKELLITLQDKNMTEQRDILNHTIEEWINNETNQYRASGQTDDIIVMGIRI